jgi:hypothetical protein
MAYQRPCQRTHARPIDDAGDAGKHTGPGIRGIVVAGMLAATMSVNSSYLLGWSAVISQDVIMPFDKFGTEL